MKELLDGTMGLDILTPVITPCYSFREPLMTRHLILLTSLLALASLQTGCISLHRTLQHEVWVVDAETLEPIDDAEIHIDYTYFMTIRAPDDFRTSTDADGYATVTTTTFRGMTFWKINAEGYISAHEIPQKPGLPPVTAHRVSSETNHTIWQIPLFREPRPVVTINLPPAYRGPLLVDIQRDHDWPPGQPIEREFNVTPNKNGVVTLKLPAGLAESSQLRAVREGQPLMSIEYQSLSRELFENPAHDEVAFRHVTRQVYVVGDQVDWVDMYLQFHEVTPNNGGINIRGKESYWRVVEELATGSSPTNR